MAIPHLSLCGFVDYAIPRQVQELAPARYTYVHLAWFTRHDSRWIGEWAGYVPHPSIAPDLVGDARASAMNTWRQEIAVQISPISSPFETVDSEWNLDRWYACPPRGAVCLDVRHFDWPVGDFCHCTFSEVDRRLDWGPPRHYVEVRLDTMEIVANQESHRPIRNAVSGQHVLDITGTALEPYFGGIWGRFVPQGDGRWRIAPLCDPCRVPASLQRALAQAPIDLDLAVPSVAAVKTAVPGRVVRE